MSLPDHIIRPAEPGDRGYIIDTWLQTYRHSPFATKLPDWAYWSRFGHVGLVEHLVDSPDTKFAVACLPEGGPWMYGWVAYATHPALTLHYVFVRDEYRRYVNRDEHGDRVPGGFGRLLFEHMQLDALWPVVTHLTADFSRRLARGRPVVFRNPYRKDVTT